MGRGSKSFEVLVRKNQIATDGHLKATLVRTQKVKRRTTKKTSIFLEKI